MFPWSASDDFLLTSECAGEGTVKAGLENGAAGIEG